MVTDDAIALCVAGEIAPNVALARLILAGYSGQAIARQLAGGQGPRIAAMRDLLSARWDAIAKLAQAAGAVDHSSSGTSALAPLRRGFNRAAAIAAEASVAFYSLGDPELLAASTNEIIAWLKANFLLGSTAHVLDLGCGIGRVAAALAPYVGSVLGVDFAPEMIQQARVRYGHDPKLRFELTDGERLTSETWSTPPDLVLAVDSFPYLVQAGVAEAHFADAACALRRSGAVAILNLSYRTLEQDQADVCRWAARFNLRLRFTGEQPFELWDGRAFVLQSLES